MKKMKKQVLAFLLCVAMLVPTLAACGPSEPSSSGADESAVPIEGNEGHIEGEATTEQVDKVVVTLGTSTVDVSPFAPSSPSVIMKNELYATMYSRPYYGAPIDECYPWIAKSYEQVDEYTYDIEIFDYITDSKGNAITADDVVFSYETSATVGQFTDAAALESITKLDDTHVRMVLNTTMPGIFEVLLTHEQLCIVNQEWYENASDDEKMNDPATTGPYTVKSFTAGAGATLVAVENYWQTDPAYQSPLTQRNVKEMEFKVVTESSMRVIGLENKEVDVTSIKASDLKNFYDGSTGKAKDGWNVGVAPGLYTYAAFLNMDSGVSILADNLELRKAILYAIDSEQIMLASGNTDITGSALHAFGCPVYEGYSEKWDQEDYYDYDPAKASECLAAAGYKPGEVTIRLLSSSSVFPDSVRSVIISQLQAVGINVDNLSVDQALFSNYKNDSSQWDLMIDVKRTSSGHITGMFNNCFNPTSYTNGSVCFTHDDVLVDMLDKAISDPSEDNLYAFGAYLRDNAICYGLYTANTIYVAQDGILDMPWNNYSYVIPGGFTYAVDYASVGK